MCMCVYIYTCICHTELVACFLTIATTDAAAAPPPSHPLPPTTTTIYLLTYLLHGAESFLRS